MRLRCHLSSYSQSQSVKLQNVLYVPSLGHSLVSWNILRHSCELRGSCDNGADFLYVYQENKLLFKAKYNRDGLPYLCLATESALPAVDSAADPSTGETATVERDNVEASTRDNTAGSGKFRS